MDAGLTRVFLGSQGLGGFPQWLDELPRRPTRAVLVPTAGNPMPATPWVNVAAAQLATSGLHVTYLDLQGARRTDVTAVLATTDLVFVTGGYPIFLLEHARRSGFDRLVTDAVRDGTLAYAGMSSGAALAGPDLAIYQAPDDPGVVDTTDGPGLINFSPLSHMNRGRQELYARIMAEHRARYEFVPMNDDQAVIVTGNTRQLRTSAIV